MAVDVNRAAAGSRGDVVFSDVAGFSISSPVNNLLAFGGQALAVAPPKQVSSIRIRVNITANSLDDTLTFTVERNGVSTTVTETIAATATGVVAISGALSLDGVDDTFGIKLTSNGNGAVTGVCAISLEG